MPANKPQPFVSTGPSAVRLVLGFVSGALFPLGFAPFEVPLISILSVGLLSWCLVGANGRLGFWLGYLFGLGKYGVGVSWIYVSINVYGNAPPLLAGLLVVIFVAGLSLMPALLGLLLGRFYRNPGAILWPVAFSFLWLLHEWLHMWILTGFPWLLLGYAQLGTPLEGFAPLAGVLLVSFAAALTGAGLFSALRSTRWRQRFGCLALVALPWLLGLGIWSLEWTQRFDSIRVALAQGSVPQALKWLPEHLELSLDTYDALMDASWEADLIVLPEAAIPMTETAANDYLDSIERRALASGTGVIVGIPRVVEAADHWAIQNAALALGRAEGAYAKRHLVPFGEYVPFESMLRGLIGFFDLPMSHTVPGRAHQPPILLNTERQSIEVALAICYEIAYPQLVSDAASEPALIITISNDAWFGSSIGPWQHLEIARMRALEMGRFVVRATNNGVTAVVRADGTIQSALGQNSREVLAAEVDLKKGTTPYQRWGHAWLILMCAVALLLLWVRAAGTRFR